MPPASQRPIDAHEFTTFMRAYRDMVYTTAARLTANAAQAEDIAQEVFLKAYESSAELRASPTARGWLKTVATHLALNHLTRYRRRWRLFTELITRDADDEGPSADALENTLDSRLDCAEAAVDELFARTDAEQRYALVERALERLPSHQRVPLVLFHFEEMSYQEIAARLDVPLGKVKTDILRGRLVMAAWLARSGLDAPAAPSGARS